MSTKASRAAALVSAAALAVGIFTAAPTSSASATPAATPAASVATKAMTPDKRTRDALTSAALKKVRRDAGPRWTVLAKNPKVSGTNRSWGMVTAYERRGRLDSVDVLLRKDAKGAWSVVAYGGNGFTCNDAPKSVLRDLQRGYVECSLGQRHYAMTNSEKRQLTNIQRATKFYALDARGTTMSKVGAPGAGSSGEKPSTSLTPKPPSTANTKAAPQGVEKRLVQVDDYFVSTRAEARRVRNYAKDGALKHREDKEQWPDSRWAIYEQTFVNGKLTSSKLLKSGGNATRENTRGKVKITQVHRLNKRATVRAPWGSNKKLDQAHVAWAKW